MNELKGKFVSESKLGYRKPKEATALPITNEHMEVIVRRGPLAIGQLTHWISKFKDNTEHIRVILEQTKLIKQEIIQIKKERTQIRPGNVRDTLNKTLNEHLSNILGLNKLIRQGAARIQTQRTQFRGVNKIITAQKKEDETKTKLIEQRKRKKSQIRATRGN